MSASFDAAARRNFPAFLTPVALSNPANATPFAVGWTRFCAMARTWPARGHLVDALAQALAAARPCGGEVIVLLIGGSFIDLGNPAPKDIDAILFYRKSDRADEVDARGLAEVQKRALTIGADVRFVPSDGDPLVLIRSVSYFTRLYSESRTPTEQHRRPARGHILVDCMDSLEADSPAENHSHDCA